MRTRTYLMAKILLISLVTLGVFGAGISQAQAEIICRPNGSLAIADADGDGVVSLGEIDALNAAAGGNADLQALRDQLAAQGVTGIQYTGCDSGSGGGDSGTGDTTDGVDGSASGADGSNASGATSGTDGESVQGKTVIMNSDGTMSTPDAMSTPSITALPAVGVGETDTGSTSGAFMSGSNLVVATVAGAMAIGGVITLRANRRT